ncbi:MAG: cupredoxin family protein [Hydrogenophaga sp.]|uniref:cupredoxin domain-containing protein n=1 Tax=Hydrogenophaga sp. TaxID=1904254 RepID=UPI0027250FAD|nr:cupredoxin family protein [Hydrogenophaga sp.]MDO9031806.1 cupredoxin family protein [Hydrogenophaga sp.]
MTSSRSILPSRSALLFSGAMLATTVAMAAGNHAGGHHESPIGKPGVVSKVTRTIQVDMSSGMRFKPSDIRVKQGETIRFVLKNTDSVKHEFSLGTPQELLEHYEVMKKFPDMEHDEPNKISLAPGKQGEVIWQFTKAGAVDFACLHVGHFDAGMKGQVKVAAK